MTQLHRSLLFAPGIRPELMQKADDGPADIVIYDLEDSVPPAAKADARVHVAAALQRPGRGVYVRINSIESGEAEADIAALAGSRVEGVMLSKAESASEVAVADRLLDEAEKRLGLHGGSVGIVPLIESCTALRAAYEIATAGKRVRGLALASAEEGDLMADIGGRWTPAGEAFLYARGRFICDGRAAGIDWLIDGVFMNFRDSDALRVECAHARNLGFIAKLAIHPRQIAVLHDVFTPSPDEVARARRVIEAFEASRAKGIGAVSVDGVMIDVANVRVAKRVLALAPKTGRQEPTRRIE